MPPWREGLELARRSNRGKRSRKRRRGAGAGAGAGKEGNVALRERGKAASEGDVPAGESASASAEPPSPGRGYSRSEKRNAATRAALEPLREGERPRAVTVGAVAAFLIAVANLIAYAAGLEVGGERPAITFVLAQSGLLLIAAWGMWRVRYWAVLGMQALLAILIVIFAVLLVVANNLLAALISVAMIAAAGALFWFLVKAMARIQMPERR